MIVFGASSRREGQVDAFVKSAWHLEMCSLAACSGIVLEELIIACVAANACFEVKH